MASASVLALVVTHRRPALLARLFDSLAPLTEEGLAGVIVVDNGVDTATAELLRARPLVTAHLRLEGNPGFGPALRHGLAWMLEHTTATHLLVTDDDTVWPRGSLAALWETAREHRAGLVVPLITDEADHIGYFPGLNDRAAFRDIRRPGMRPEDFRARAGVGPFAFTWAPSCAWLLAREAVEHVGLPREDFGFMAEDIEYALRVTYRQPGLLDARVAVAHLPPRKKRGPEGSAVAALHLQNIAFITCRLPHGRRSLRHLPGGIWRYLRSQGLAALPEALRLLWDGAVRGRPGGAPGADRHWRELRRVLNAP